MTDGKFENCQPKDSGKFEKSQSKPARCGCGGEAVVKMWAEPDTPFLVMCEKCKASSGDYSSEAEAIEAWNTAMGAKDTFKYEIDRRSGKTLESAVDYLRSVGWLQEHDRIMTESAEPERKAKVKVLYRDESVMFGHCECGQAINTYSTYCPQCGAKLEWE